MCLIKSFYFFVNDFKKGQRRLKRSLRRRSNLESTDSEFTKEVPHVLLQKNAEKLFKKRRSLHLHQIRQEETIDINKAVNNNNTELQMDHIEVEKLSQKDKKLFLMFLLHSFFSFISYS